MSKDWRARGTACAKVLGQDCAWCAGGTASRSVWLEQSEREGEGVGEGREKSGAGHTGPMGHREDLSLYLKEGGYPGGLWGEKDKT